MAANHLRPKRSRRFTLTLVAGLGLALLAILPLLNLGAAPAAAANANDFNAGYIASDSVFFDSNSMSIGQIQDFLNSQVSSCRSGYTCLKDYGQRTSTLAGDQYCSGYAGSGWDSAATIIYKTAQSCGISPKVLIVLLEKEQSLVTDTWPTAGQYNAATGNGCPDSAGCDQSVAGFFFQVYFGARAFQRYVKNNGAYNYHWNQYNSILYSTNTSCGRANIFIANAATAALYNYTPYTPNAAALNNLYGTGDSCSSYGNRNFWRIFTDWFGNPAVPNDVSIVSRYTALGANGSLLGNPTTGQNCGLRDNGCWRGYDNGSIYASDGRPTVYISSGAIYNRWAALGYEHSDASGSLGYPLTDTNTGLRNNGAWQGFENGAIYTWSSGTYVIRNGAIRDYWTRQNYESGWLGYPVGDTVTNLRNGGSYQQFENGFVYASASGAYAIARGAIYNRWASLGYEQSVAGSLGYPIGDAGTTLNGGTWQGFESGAIYSWNGGTFVVLNGSVRNYWAAQNYEHGPLGLPVADTVTNLASGGSSQAFQNGYVYSSSAGTFTISGRIYTAWAAAGAQSTSASGLGYPVSEALTSAGGAVWQFFQQGALVDNGTTVTKVDSAVAASLRGSGIWTQLGAATGASFTPSNTAYLQQNFVGGTTFLTGQTVCSVTNPFFSKWGGTDASTGGLGYPQSAVLPASNGGSWQKFDNGAIYLVSGQTYVVRQPVFTKWAAQNYEHGALGWPLSDTVTGLRDGGSWQPFQGGAIYSSSSGTFVLTNGAIRDRWGQLGWEHSVSTSLGYPTSDVAPASNGGSWQQFENGAIYLVSGQTYVVRQPVFTKWAAQNYEHGALGWPLSDTVTGLRDGGSWQPFQGGAIYSSSSGTFVLTNGAIRNYWTAQNYEKGPLGYPTGDFVATSTGGTQAFQGGTLVWNSSTGRVVAQ